MSENHPIGLSIRGGSKLYPGTQALKNVDFDLRMGAVNVLVGENGAGKSTLMKVIAGVEQLNGGTITLDGSEVVFSDKSDAARHGVGIVFQELNLFPNLTVTENIFIGHEKTRAGIHIDRTAQASSRSSKSPKRWRKMPAFSYLTSRPRRYLRPKLMCCFASSAT